MDYTAEEFADLVRAVEQQGGQQLPDMCLPTVYRLKQPTPSGPRRVDVETVGCEQFCLLAIPYDPEPKSKKKVNAVTACAVDDNVGMWPRFRRKR